MQRRIKFVAFMLAGGIAASGCQTSDSVGTSQIPSLGVLPANPAANGAADYEEFELCKFGSTANFSYSAIAYGGANQTLPGAPQNGNVSLTDGQCKVIATYGGFGAEVTITETSAESGFHLDRVDVTVLNGGSNKTTVAGPSVTEWISGTRGGGLRGALVEYFNARDLTGEGCTPGYWKQPHHFDSWPAGILPTDLFSAYFEDAFPGKTLLQVLSTGGGKLIALGRHTVAALLNSASDGVDYPLTMQQVIDEFNATFPTSNYGPQKDRFGVFNESGCPLN